MNDDLVTLKFLVVTGDAAEREAVRLAASQASVPIECSEMDEADGAESVCRRIAGDSVDAIFLDSGMPLPACQAVADAARTAKGHPLVVTIGPGVTAAPAGSRLAYDGMLAKPVTITAAKAAVEACVRARIPSRALIVDDSPTVRAVMRKVFQSSRHRLETDECDDGRSALEKIKSQHFDIVFIDCNMPDIDGWRTLAELRKTHPDLKVVMISGTNEAGIADRVRAAGGDELLIKPFYAKDIDAALSRIFGLMPHRPFSPR